MRIGIVQFNALFGAVARNIAKAISMVKDEQADLWVLPELFATGYQFKDAGEAAFFAEEVGGPTLTTMAHKAEEFGCYFCGGFAERAGEEIFNSAFLVGPEGLVGVYRKVHLFDREKELFTAGDRGFSTWNVGGVSVGMMICFDWIFPESARSLALGGAQLILHPANLVLPHCPMAMKTRALENRVFTVTANRIGTECRVEGEELTYIGQSVVYSPRGELLLSAGADSEEALIVDLDESLALDKRVTGRNDAFSDRRTTHYRLD